MKSCDWNCTFQCPRNDGQGVTAVVGVESAGHLGEVVPLRRLSTNCRPRDAVERFGKPIGPLDTLIASQAVARKLTLVSNNRKEFGRVPGLDIGTGHGCDCASLCFGVPALPGLGGS